MSTRTVWGGRISDALGLQVIGDVERLDRYAGLALRHNPARAQLLVSRVLAKHIPVPANTAQAAGYELADRVLGAGMSPEETLVIGFAETATGLGHFVAERLHCAYLHTTRDLRGQAAALEFQETHSHAPGHALLASALPALCGARHVVLVDDELSTGATALALVEQLRTINPGLRGTIAALIDVRPAGSAGAEGIDHVSLLQAHLHVPADAPDRAASILAAAAAPRTATATHRPPHRASLSLPATGRQYLSADRHRPARAAVAGLAQRLGNAGGRTLVVGTEETMWPAIALAADLGGHVQSTTRSPVAVLADEPGYPISAAVTFPSCYDPDVPAFLYNGAGWGTVPLWDRIVVVTDTRTTASGILEAAGGLLDALDPVSRDPMCVVTVGEMA